MTEIATLPPPPGAAVAAEISLLEAPGRAPETPSVGAHEAAATPRPSVAYEDLPELVFPRRFQIIQGGHVGHTGEIGGIWFKDGVTVDAHPYRVVNSFAGGFGVVGDLATGVKISPIFERSRYTVEHHSRFWNYGQPLPEGAPVYDDAAAALGDQTLLGSSTLDALIRIGEHDVQLGAIVAKAFADSGLDVASWNALGAGARDAALEMTIAALRAAAPEPDETVERVLQALLVAKGAKYLRQACEARGLPTAREGAAMVATLAQALTLADAKAL